MLLGVLLAILAGLMLGFYAVPEKFAKDFEFENTWGLFFLIAMFIVPAVAAISFIKGFGNILTNIPIGILLGMLVASVLWGVGMLMWGKAINHIGVSLGFSLFLGTIILIGSLLPFIVDGLPQPKVLITILIGILIVLLGIYANGKAGILRQKDEDANILEKVDPKSMAKGIFIAVAGGVLATGFSFANAVGRPTIHQLSVSQGNPEWVTSLGVMFVIYVAGGLFAVPFFVQQLTQKNLWNRFKTKYLVRNVSLATTMAILNFAASAVFAFSAFKLGSTGNSVGYAIYNASSVIVAMVSGIVTKEWSEASHKAKSYLYLGLVSMVLGVIVISIGNSMAG